MVKDLSDKESRICAASHSQDSVVKASINTARRQQSERLARHIGKLCEAIALWETAFHFISSIHPLDMLCGDIVELGVALLRVPASVRPLQPAV
jgi:hypothetical protein